METKKETKRKPRGAVRCWYRADRPNRPYYLQWRVDGKKLTESYVTKEDRDGKCADLRKQAKANLLGEVPARAEILEFRAFKSAIGDADWRDVVDDWRKMGCTSSLKVEDKRAKKLQDGVLLALVEPDGHSSTASPKRLRKTISSRIALRSYNIS